MKGDSEIITLWHCLNCGMPTDTPSRCHICGYGIRPLDETHLLSGEKEAAEEQLRLNRENPWDSEAENNITRSLRVFRRWEDE